MAWSGQAGLVVRDVLVEGRRRTPPEALRERLDLDIGMPLLAVDTAAAKDRLETLAWVEQASVARMLPDTVQVRLLERQPLALWQRDGRFEVIDRAGAVIEGAANDRPQEYAHLRVLVGDDAPQGAATLFALLSTEPALSARVVAATRVGGRRWNVHLDNQVEVLLPERNALGAWRLLADKARDDALLERAVTVIDLRFLPERLRLRLDPRRCRITTHEHEQRDPAAAARTARAYGAGSGARRRHQQDVLPDRAPPRRPARAAGRWLSARGRPARGRDRRCRGSRGVDPGGGARGRAAGRAHRARDRARHFRRPSGIDDDDHRHRARRPGGRPGGPDPCPALARAQARTDGAEILHALPVEITLDSSQGLRDARGMVGERLRITVHLVRVASAALYNLVAAIERCHLDVAAVIAAPYAAGLASLSEDEATSGALVLDLGAGVTGVARFADRRLQQLASLPLGAQHVTQDLAFGLSTGRAQAERLKTLYGGVLARAGDVRQQLEVPGLGDPMHPPVQIVSRARLTEIIRPRIEEIFQLARARMHLDRLPLAGRRLVLTGGGSQLEGIVELAEETFGMPARLGRARPFDAGAVHDLTAATTAAGLLRWAGEDDGGLTFGVSSPQRDFTARLARLGQWLRENF